MLSALALVACRGAPPEGVHEVRELSLRLVEGAAPPGDGGSWQAIELPDLWGLERRARATEGWYRVDVALERTPDEVWAVFLPHVSLNAAVWVNGQPVGDGGPFQPRLARNFNRPLYFTVPAPLLVTGPNRIHVRLATTPGTIGRLDVFEVGPDRLLRGRYAWTTLGRAQLAVFVVVALGFVGFMTVLARRGAAHPGLAGWMSAALVLWACSALFLILREPPVPARLWEWINSQAAHWSLPCFVFGVHRLLGVHRPRTEATIVAVGLAFTILHAAVPAVLALAVGTIWTFLWLPLAFYLAVLVIEASRRGLIGQPGPALGLALVGLAFAAHDLQAFVTGRHLGLSLFQFFPLLAVSMFAWGMLGRVFSALRETEAMNLGLESRVEEKHLELERNYERLGRLERERAVADERERILRDIHDGTGSQLVSALSLIESGRADPEEIANTLRDALDDLRLMIDSLDPEDEDILPLLGTLRSRLEPRLRRHGLRFVWEVRDVPTLVDFGPHSALQVLRIVQEAISNVMKHARAASIRIRTGGEYGTNGRPGLFVEVRDDGRGMGRAAAGGGRGIRNMRERAARAGGELRIESDTAGTAVHLWLPAV